MNRKVEVECPYCQVVNKVDLGNQQYIHTEVVTCNTNDGGCDKEFVAKVYLFAKVETYEMNKVEKDAEK